MTFTTFPFTRSTYPRSNGKHSASFWTGIRRSISNTRLIPFLSAFSILSFGSGVQAVAQIHVGPSSTGNGSGADWNNRAAWSSVNLVRGQTYYLADGTYDGRTLSTAASGSQLITIKKAVASDHGSATGWSSALGDGQAVITGKININSSYWTIDGQKGGGPGSWDSGYGIRIIYGGTTANMRRLIQYNATVSDITLAHLDLSYDGNDSLSYPSDEIGTSQDAIHSGYSMSNIRYSYLRINRPGRTAMKNVGSLNNITIEYCYVRQPVVGPISQHGEIWSAQCSSFRDVTIRYNHFYYFRSTGGLMFSGADGVDIYGNLFEKSIGDGNGVIANWSTRATSSNVRIFNNTFIGVNAKIGFGNTGSGWVVRNNLFLNNYNTSIVSGSHDFNAADVNMGEANGQILSSSIVVDFEGGDFRLAAPTKAGASISGSFAVDMLGNARVTGSRGAFEYVGGSEGTIAAPAAPLDLVVDSD